MDGADLRHLQEPERVGEPIVLEAARTFPRALELGTQAQLHLSRRFVGESDREHAVERRPPAAKERDDARDQFSCLAGTRRGLDDQRRIEVTLDAGASLCVGQRHGIPRRRTSGAMRSVGLRSARRSADESQTAR